MAIRFPCVEMWRAHCMTTSAHAESAPLVRQGIGATIIPLGPGNGGLALTTAPLFQHASGRSIQAQRFTPDYRSAAGFA